jgi:microcompartment protein CcmL/EutN
MQEALGIIETHGYATAVEAADAAVKAANVKLGSLLTKVGSGRVSVIIRGDVAAVKSAVEAGVAAASQAGTVLAQAVIPRPSEKTAAVFPLRHDLPQD